MLIGSKLRQIFGTLVIGCKPLASQFISCSVPFLQPLLSRSMRDPFVRKKTQCLIGWPIGFLLKLYPSHVSSHIYTCVYVCIYILHPYGIDLMYTYIYIYIYIYTYIYIYIYIIYILYIYIYTVYTFTDMYILNLGIDIYSTR